MDGGAQVEAMPAGRGGVAVDCGIGEDGRTGGPDFLCVVRRLRALSSISAAARATSARMM